jgi:predicted dehydrogenase
MKPHFTIICISILTLISINLSAQSKPIRVAIAGLTHTHVHWILGREKQNDIIIVGIVEPNRELAKRYSEQHGFSMNLVYDNMSEMLKACKPEAVCAFGSIFQHLEVVEACAPKGIHVMVEKPLAVSLDHALKMKSLAEKHNIHLLTNYETTWYPSNHKAFEFLHADSIGDVRKVIVRDGHRGPKKIGINEEFLDWLTDPVLNGGGAIIDFGCYGVNLMTCLMNGEKPLSVTAVTQQLQAENNPLVDDESIIILAYEKSNAIIQGSWNWPMGRKDIEIYGLTGALYADNRNDLRMRIAVGYDGFKETSYHLEEMPKPYHDPFSYFAAVINQKIVVKPFDLSSLDNNVLVMEILDAAIRSAALGKTIQLSK